MTELNKFEMKYFSQNGEDGALLYLFSKIGVFNRCFLEIGIEDGRECNSANLAINFGWHGLMIEGNERRANKAQAKYRLTPGIIDPAVKVIQCFVTTKNINDVLVENGMTGEMDLLSIDIDGNDYWIWDVISVISPRVVVIEFNASFGPEKSLTVPYDESYVCHEKHPSGWYHGASLTALTRLGIKKGYTLTGTNGVNAFFVKNELANPNKLPNLTPEQAFFPLENRLKKATLDEQLETISHLPLVEIK